MRTKIIEFPRSKKKPNNIEDEINKILLKYNLFYAHQMENPDSGKIILTLILRPYKTGSKGVMQVKAFRNTRLKDTESQLNDFMSECKLKFFSQSFSSNTVTSLVFHEVLRNPEADQDPPPPSEGNENKDPTIDKTEE